jgi:fucose 4-O-acetylase-like acetyltransferase
MVRDDRIDSLKGVLITFVVFGHSFLYGHPQDAVKMTVANWVYLFHMPFFVFLSGYFTHTDSQKYWKGVLAILESYVVFQLLKGILQGFSLYDFFLVPAPMMWYLLALIVWRCLFFFVNKVARSKTVKWVICISLFVLGLLVGFEDGIGKTLALSRIIVFAPFFYLGTLSQGFDFIGFCKKMPKWLAALIMLLAVALVAFLTPQDYVNVRETVRGASGYGVDNTMVGFIARLIYYILAIVMSISLTSLVSSSKLLGQIGKDSLKYYLFHGILLSFMVFLKLPWNWYFAFVYGAMLMVILYFFNKTKLSDFAIRPITYTLDFIKSRQENQNNN